MMKKKEEQRGDSLVVEAGRFTTIQVEFVGDWPRNTPANSPGREMVGLTDTRERKADHTTPSASTELKTNRHDQAKQARSHQSSTSL